MPILLWFCSCTMAGFLDNLNIRRLFSTVRTAGKGPRWTKDSVNQDVLRARWVLRTPQTPDLARGSQ